ncbi:MAG: FMN-binding protein [Clostridia bacterium]|nr:FMN-binding protein [Clostridia bacterium]
MKSLKSIAALASVCAVIAIMLAVTNYFTAPIIAENEEKAVSESLLLVMPNGKDFEKMDISALSLPEIVSEVYRETDGGYVFKLETKGQNTGLIIMCGVYADGTVSGARCIASKEDLKHEKTYGERFTGLDLAGAEEVDTVSQATNTTSAYKEAVKTALEAAKILKGGEQNEK